MRIATTEVAGLTGGLYELFENLGLRFFSFLIGSVRATRLELEYKRVTAGATLVGATLGAVLGFLNIAMAALASRSASLGCLAIGALLGGALIGAFLGLILAAVMLSYIKGLRAEAVRSVSKPASGVSFDTILAEQQQKYIDSGYPPKEAYREAWWFAALTTRRIYG